MTYHSGYPELHAAVALAHIGTNVWFQLNATHARPFVRFVTCAGTASLVLCHITMGLLCFPPSFGGVLHGYFETYPHLRVRLLQNHAMCQLIHWVAVYITWKAEQGAWRFAKVSIIAVQSLVSACLLACWWNLRAGNDTLDVPFSCIGTSRVTGPQVLHSLWLSGALGVISSMYGCIYRAKRTLLLLFDLLVLTPAFLLVLTIMRANFSFDVEGRIIPHTPEDAVHPHWASVVQVVSWDLRFLASNIILSHTLVFSSSTVKTALPSSSSQLSLGQTIARRKAFDWIIPVMFCFVAWLVRKSYTPMMVQGPDVPQRLLLHVQAILGTSWPIQTAAVVLMVMSLMLVIKSNRMGEKNQTGRSNILKKAPKACSRATIANMQAKHASHPFYAGRSAQKQTVSSETFAAMLGSSTGKRDTSLTPLSSPPTACSTLHSSASARSMAHRMEEGDHSEPESGLCGLCNAESRESIAQSPIHSDTISVQHFEAAMNPNNHTGNESEIRSVPTEATFAYAPELAELNTFHCAGHPQDLVYTQLAYRGWALLGLPDTNKLTTNELASDSTRDGPPSGASSDPWSLDSGGMHLPSCESPSSQSLLSGWISSGELSNLSPQTGLSGHGSPCQLSSRSTQSGHSGRVSPGSVEGGASEASRAHTAGMDEASRARRAELSAAFRARIVVDQFLAEEY